MSEVPHLLGVSRPCSLSLPLVLSLHVPMCLWENGPPLSVPMADPLPLSGPRPLGVAASLSPCLCLCLLLPCLAFLGHTCLCLFSFLGGGSLQISPAIFVLLPGPHLSPLVFSGCLCLSGEISVYLSLHLRRSIAVLRPISLCVWTSLPGSGSLQPPPSLFLKVSLRSHLQPPSSAPRLPISLEPRSTRAPPPCSQAPFSTECVCPGGRPRRWREGTPMTSPTPLRPPPPFPFPLFQLFLPCPPPRAAAA